MRDRTGLGWVLVVLAALANNRAAADIIDPGAPTGNASFPATLDVGNEQPETVGEGSSAAVSFKDASGKVTPFVIQPGFVILSEEVVTDSSKLPDPCLWSDVVQFDNGEVGGNGRVLEFSEGSGAGGISAALIKQVQAAPADMIRVLTESATADFIDYTAQNVGTGNSGTYRIHSDIRTTDETSCPMPGLPEPTSLKLVGVGLLLLLGGRRLVPTRAGS